MLSSAQWLPVRDNSVGAVFSSAAEYEVACSISFAKWLRTTREQRFRTPSGCRARPSNDLERNERKKQRWGGVFECCRIPRSLLEQRLRALGGLEARPSSDFERPMTDEHSRAVKSSTKHALRAVFECSCVVTGLSAFRFERRIYYIIYLSTF